MLNNNENEVNQKVKAGTDTTADVDPLGGGCLGVFLSLIVTAFLVIPIINALGDKLKIPGEILIAIIALCFVVITIYSTIYIFTPKAMADSAALEEKKRKEKELKKGLFHNIYGISNGREIVGKAEIKDKDIVLSYNTGITHNYNILDILKIELIQAQEVHLKHGVGGAVLGGLAAGPIGAAAGASMGRLLRECNFLLEFPDGRIIICKSIYKLFEDLCAHYKINKIVSGQVGIDDVQSPTGNN